ncbi:MAG: lytic murein transglycosylase, partial [Solirubrobacteraceae bacterium]
PALPSTLSGSLSGVPNFFLNSFSIPPFLLPIYQAAGTAYGIPWQVLAAINEVETDYGRDLSVSSAGAEGWMQFLPAEWEQYGVDATAQGYEDPYNPADAIFAAARYLKAAGGDQNIRAAIYSYNHSQAYVASVMLRAQLLGGTPSGLLTSITGLTEARFPVHAPSHFADGFPELASSSAGALHSTPGTIIYSEKSAPVIAVQDGVITKIGESATLGKYISLKDTFGNTYTYAQLGSLATLYPVLELREHSLSALAAQASPESESAPSGPASAGSQPRSPLSQAATTSSLALGAAASIGSQAPPASRPQTPPASAAVHEFRAGPDEVYLHQLRVGVQVIAGTVLGHLGEGEAASPEPHMLFQIRPSGTGSPLIDPKPVLDGWVLLEDSSVYKAKGADPFAQTKPSAGQVLLESKNQLEQQVLANPSIHIYACGRGDIQTGKIDRRVLAVLEFLSVSGLEPSVTGLRCGHPGSPEYLSGETVNISAINGKPIAGHSGPGSLAARAIARLLDLQGTVRPLQLSTPTRHPKANNTITLRGPYTHIHLSFASLYSSNARLARKVNSELSPDQWIKLIARLGEIPNPQVANSPSSAAIPDPSTQSSKQSGALGG